MESILTKLGFPAKELIYFVKKDPNLAFIGSSVVKMVMPPGIVPDFEPNDIDIACTIDPRKTELYAYLTRHETLRNPLFSQKLPSKESERYDKWDHTDKRRGFKTYGASGVCRGWSYEFWTPKGTKIQLICFGYETLTGFEPFTGENADEKMMKVIDSFPLNLQRVFFDGKKLYVDERAKTFMRGEVMVVFDPNKYYTFTHYNDFKSAIQSMRNYRSKGFKLIPPSTFRVGSWGLNGWNGTNMECPEDLYLGEDGCKFLNHYPKFILERGQDRDGSYIKTLVVCLGL